MAFLAELMDTQTKRNPISTSDDALLWLAENSCTVDFKTGKVTVRHDLRFTKKVTRAITPSHDARGTLMMATRELWEMVNK